MQQDSSMCLTVWRLVVAAARLASETEIRGQRSEVRGQRSAFLTSDFRPLASIVAACGPLNKALQQVLELAHFRVHGVRSIGKIVDLDRQQSIVAAPAELGDNASIFHFALAHADLELLGVSPR